MAVQAVPTKGNLMNAKKSLALARNGYELLDRKRNILIREMMTLIDHANEIQAQIDDAYEEAYLRCKPRTSPTASARIFPTRCRLRTACTSIRAA